MAIITSLVSYWKFDESSGNAADSHGSNTLVNNGTIPYVTGKINNGADLGGGDDYFSIADGSQTGLDLTTDFSVALWLRIDTAPSSSSQVICSKRAGGNGYSIYYSDAAGTKKFEFTIQGTAPAGINYDLGTGTFHYVVFVYTKSAGTIQVYVDGASIGTNTGHSTALAGSTDSFKIGDDGASRFLTGVVDEFGIWAKALTANEIISLYNVNAGFEYPFPSAPTFTLAESTTLTESILYDMSITVPLETVTLTETHSNRFGWVNETKNTSTWTNQDKS